MKLPLECKNAARDVKNYDHERWKQEAKATCTPGILTKFEQSSALLNLLVSTGLKTLVECSKDKQWGTGVPLYEENCLDKTRWTSQGLLGEILESVQGIVSKTASTTDTHREMDVQDTVVPHHTP